MRSLIPLEICSGSAKIENVEEVILLADVVSIINIRTKLKK